jgi:mannan endo-1,4-beta-mannosidase
MLGLLGAPVQAQNFVSRDADTLLLDGRPWYFQGANAYALPTAAARGDTTQVERIMAALEGLGLTVLRTWAFYDAGDSSDPAVIQSAPGRYHESGLRGLDFVLVCAARHGLRLVLPLVNNWDDYGGMNQYVRWRALEKSNGLERPPLPEPGSPRRITGARGQSYLSHPVQNFSHDAFYTDPVIAQWYSAYVEMILTRTNSYTGVPYRNDPTVLAWELANEPRSSDGTGTMIGAWAERSARWVKSVDSHHLLGTGEEGFDITEAGYSTASYGAQRWMFDGTAGVSFTRNVTIADIDFAGIHLYPDSWNLPSSAGNSWIRDHLQIARAGAKALIVGEYGLRGARAAAYDSWLTTVLADGGAGAALWQFGSGTLPPDDGFVVWCEGQEDPVCAVLRYHAELARQKSDQGFLPPPVYATFLLSYPNPCTSQATLRYTLAAEARVTLRLFSLLGQQVAVLVDGYQGAGERRELFDGRGLPSGVYVSLLRVSFASGGGFTTTARLVLLH